MKQTVLSALGASIIVLLLAYFGVTKALGAHPWWSFKVALIGAPIGIFLTLVLSLLAKWGALVALADLVLAGLITWQGKRMFAASSGEDQLGGQMWYFGWIAVCACAVAVIALTLRRRAG